MKKYTALVACLMLLTSMMLAQTRKIEPLPYREIPDYPASYSAGTIAARVLDGLGFRYYWATEGLEKKDLSYRPGTEARSSEETLDHILGLTSVIVNATLMKPNVATDRSGLSFEEKRTLTLKNIETAANILRTATDEEVEKFEVVFQNDNGKSTYPFWNLLNGPVDDALWHVGQVVSFRRSSGNPFNPNVSVFNGKLRD